MEIYVPETKSDVRGGRAEDEGRKTKQTGTQCSTAEPVGRIWLLFPAAADPPSPNEVLHKAVSIIPQHVPGGHKC